MRFFYNIIQLAALILLGPILFVKIILTPKYRGRIARRLGKGLSAALRSAPPARPRIWVHALSVGEASSSLPLVKGVREAFPEACIIYSATTRSGEEYAIQTLRQEVDIFVPFPLDLYWSVQRFVDRLAPDLFILVETDFWPNLLKALQDMDVPAILVNGRISARSYARFRRLKGFFLPMFTSFQFISMQTEADAVKMVELGVAADRVKPLGNLKYDSILPARSDQPRLPDRLGFGIPKGALVWVAGSTHAGEEQILFPVYKRLAALFPDLFLVVAPRIVERGKEVLQLAGQHGLSAWQRTGQASGGGRVLVLDTLGELSGLYGLCDIAFVGGSLVARGGHNPLEPAGFGKPVLFGPHMEDFAEISRDLLHVGGGVTVHDGEELFARLKLWLADESLRLTQGERARSLVLQHQGVTARHMALIHQILGQGAPQ